MIHALSACPRLAFDCLRWQQACESAPKTTAVQTDNNVLFRWTQHTDLVQTAKNPLMTIEIAARISLQVLSSLAAAPPLANPARNEPVGHRDQDRRGENRLVYRYPLGARAEREREREAHQNSTQLTGNVEQRRR